MPSQQEEDKLIKDYLGGYATGCYIDIGAGDPIKFSNTHALYQKGWKGLVIEPFPESHKRWAELRPNDILLPIAVMHYNGEATMCRTATVGSWVGNEYAEKYSGEIYKVACNNIVTILRKYPEFQKAEFVSIDIESNEDNLLANWNFDLCRPKIICIERQLRGVDQRDRWEQYLLPFYCMDNVTYTNAFYKRR